jgi:hypothetical protein
MLQLITLHKVRPDQLFVSLCPATLSTASLVSPNELSLI